MAGQVVGEAMRSESVDEVVHWVVEPGQQLLLLVLALLVAPPVRVQRPQREWARMVCELALGDGATSFAADDAEEWAAAAAKVRAALGLALGRADDDATRARWDRMLREISEEPPNTAPEAS